MTKPKVYVEVTLRVDNEYQVTDWRRAPGTELATVFGTAQNLVVNLHREIEEYLNE